MCVCVCVCVCVCISDDPIFDHKQVYLPLCYVGYSGAGPDNIPAIMIIYRYLATELTPALVIIFQKSYISGKIPDMWRHALIKPIFFNKFCRDKAENYKPLSLTCIANKTLEGIIRVV